MGRTGDISQSTRLIASSTVPSASTKMMLLCRPMISTASVSRVRSPNSFTQSKSRYSARSSPGWRSPTSRPPVSRLRSSIQNIGGAAGFSGTRSVKWMRGEFARADKYSLRLPCRLRSAITSSSREGWWILSMRASCASVWCSSRQILCKKMPSSAIAFYLVFLAACRPRVCADDHYCKTSIVRYGASCAKASTRSAGNASPMAYRSASAATISVA